MYDDCCCGALKEVALVMPGNLILELSTVAILATRALTVFEAHCIFSGSEVGESCLVDQQMRISCDVDEVMIDLKDEENKH